MNIWRLSDINKEQISLYLIIITELSIIVLLCLGTIFMYGRYRLYRNDMYIDTVTLGSNLKRFKKDAKEYLGSNKNLVAAIVNINEFRYINDYYGIENGNAVLKFLYDKIHDVVGDKGICCRSYNDNFLILTEYIERDRFLYIMKNYLSGFTVTIGDRNIFFKCNCGVYFIEDKNLDLEKMFDKATVSYKNLSVNQAGSLGVYDTELDRIFLNNKKYIVHMQEAIRNDEFKTYIQPKICLRTGRCVGGEALVRWISDKYGYIRPSEFIPLFEKNGYVVDIDWCVLRSVKDFITNRLEQKKRVVKISVNQSRIHLNNPYYLNELETVIGEAVEVKPYIEFEITESTFLDRKEDSIELIKKLNKLGFSISIDDFGSGYSSLSMLKDIDFQVLKIDQSFLQKDGKMSKRADMIIKSVIDLAHNLGSEVVCEGVENEEQAETLREFGCDMIQGFYYGKPMTLESFAQYLDNDKF